MAPKKSRDSKMKINNNKSISEDSWISEIDSLTLNDDSWTCVIGIIAETKLEHVDYLNNFNEAAESETRSSILSLSYKKLIRETKLLAKSEPLHQGICNFASKQMEKDETEDVVIGSSWLLCRLIKFFINRVKIRHLEIEESKANIEREITKEIESLQEFSVKPNTVVVAKSKGDKFSSKLRKRGDKKEGIYQIDDAPIVGPNLYVVLTGFYDVNLINELINYGLPLNAVFKVLRPTEEIDVNSDNKVFNDFWSGFEKSKTSSRYSDIVCQTFCPPEIKYEEDLETLKNDAYKRISYLMYDLCDLKRQHDCYVGKIIIQNGLDEEKPEIQETDIYDSIMQVIPEECATVPIVLDALLSQIDGFEKYPKEFVVDQPKISAETRFRSKIDDLNDKFDVFDARRTEIPEENIEPRFIDHGDDFGRQNYDSIIGDDFGIRVLKEFCRAVIWKNVPTLIEEKIKTYDHHVERISKSFDVDVSTIKHYLHLLLFDKMINGENFQSKTTSSSLKAEETEFPELFELINCVQEITSQESFPDSNSGLLNLEDYDSVQFLSTRVFSQVFFTCYREFDSFETRYFPPTDSFLVLFYNDQTNDEIINDEYSASIRTPICFRDFNDYIIDDEKEWLKKEEELNNRRLAAAAAVTFSKIKKTSEDFQLAGNKIYKDSDFVLKNCLKVTEVGKQKSRQSLINVTAEAAGFSRDEFPALENKKNKKKKEKMMISRIKEEEEEEEKAKETNPKKVKTPKRKGTIIKPSNKNEEEEEEDEEVENHPTTLNDTTSIKSQEYDELPTFVGYDISNQRIQISGRTSHFRSKDGTVVKVIREELLSREESTRSLNIIIEFLGNNLVSQIVNEYPITLHLTTTNGILMAFSLEQSNDERNCLQVESSELERESAKGTKLIPEMAVDPGFRTSWPSGLVVQTVPGDANGPEVPFYIKQSYLSKGPECNEISKETQRVFLRDGTIVVFLDDQTVRLMRSNGLIVDCKGFKEKQQQGQDPRIVSKIILEPDGKFYEIHDDDGSTNELDQKLVRTASDYEVGEIFTRRNDGTNFLLNSDGVLAVSFPDDSRITTGFVIDDDPVCCEWSEEEYETYFSSTMINHESKSMETVILEDGFVSINQTFCMEHKNYGTVKYDQSKTECVLSMPDDVEVNISLDGIVRVNVGDAISLEVTRDEILFNGKLKTPEKGFSTSVLRLKNYNSTTKKEKKEDNNYLLWTKDSLGNIFIVDSQGETSQGNMNGIKSNLVENDEMKNDKNYSSSSGLFFTREDNNHDDNNKFQPNSRTGYRLFVVKRDLSSYEHLHHSVKMKNQEEKNNQDQNQLDRWYKVFFNRVNDESRSELDEKIRTILTPLNPTTTSKLYLQSYKVKRIKPKNEGRRDLLRSTYSFPWNYLIPYGKKNGRGIYDRTCYVPLKLLDLKNLYQKSKLTNLILVRTIETIKIREDLVLKKFKEALACYSMKKSISDSHRNEDSTSFRSDEDFDTAENWVEGFSPGARNTFDTSFYFDDDDDFPKIQSNKIDQESKILKRNISAREDDKNEMEWYKFCLKDKIVPPYFRDIHGACFTWVFECFEKIEEIITTKERNFLKKDEN